MLWQWRGTGRSRSGLTLVELVLALAAVGLVGGLILANHRAQISHRGQLPVRAVAEAPIAPAETAVVEPRSETLQGEISLQETLDRLGYTVNIPTQFHGWQLNGRGDRVSTGDDTIASGWFRSRGPVTFQVVSEQSMLGGSAALSVVTRLEQLLPVLHPEAGGPRSWLGHGGSRVATLDLPQPARLCLDFPPNPYNSGRLYSTSGDNPDGVSYLMVLPARQGGRWVEEDGIYGHWEGGEDTGEYLLCWEDWRNGGADFQDLVILARGLEPVEE